MKKITLTLLLILLSTTGFAQNAEEITNVLQGEWLVIGYQIEDEIFYFKDYEGLLSELIWIFQGNNVKQTVKHPDEDMSEIILDGTFVISNEYIIIFENRTTEVLTYDFQGNTLILRDREEASILLKL